MRHGGGKKGPDVLRHVLPYWPITNILEIANSLVDQAM